MLLRKPTLAEVLDAFCREFYPRKTRVECSVFEDAIIVFEGPYKFTVPMRQVEQFERHMLADMADAHAAMGWP